MVGVGVGVGVGDGVGTGLTVMVAVDPVIDGVTVSVAVTVQAPAVFSVTGKVPVPLVRVASAGSVAALSELVKCTVPG
jgi:hypothetical protein